MPKRHNQLKHPMSAPVKTGVEALSKTGLMAESSMSDDIEILDAYSEFLISAHAPATIGEARLNYAATDPDFRRMSIETIVGFIHKASRYPHIRQENMHFAPKRWVADTQPAGQEGNYSLLIDAIREIGKVAEENNIEIVLENNNAYWADVPDNVQHDEVDWDLRNAYFGMAPEEWIQTCEDVNRPNVRLCLDSSHVCTYAHTLPEELREERVLAFLDQPALIKHVHWSDNYLYDSRGRNDSHLELNKGSLPTELHRRIKYLDATLLLEHFYSVHGLEEELVFIDSL